MSSGGEQAGDGGVSSHVVGADGAAPVPVVVLASGAGSLAEAVILAARENAAPFRVEAVVSDRDCEALERARRLGVEGVVVAPSRFESRADWDAALTDTLLGYGARWVVTAGFMRLLGERFTETFAERAINSHPSLLPAFPGAHGVRDALDYGVKVTGCTVHLIDAGLDTGPVIAQETVEVADDDTESGLHERIKRRERTLLVEVLADAVRGRLTINGRKVVRA